MDSIDPALRRAKRFDKEVALGIPDEEARKSILEIVSRYSLALFQEFLLASYSINSFFLFTLSNITPIYFIQNLRNLRLGKDVNFERIARLTPGYVGADLNALAREASLSAIYR